MKNMPIIPSKKTLGTVQLRGGFSDRNKINSVSTQIQYDAFDERTRVLLYNKLIQTLDNIDDSINNVPQPVNIDWRDLYLSTLEEVYCFDLSLLEDSITRMARTFNQYIESTIKDDTYDAILTVIEFIFSWTNFNFINRRLLRRYVSDNKADGQYETYIFNEFEFLNTFFEKECVGYRFVGNQIVKITDPIEIQEIEEAIQCDFDGCRTHINNAVGFLANRETKDYKNCIKESISAVESICKVILGKDNATMGDALKELERKRGLKGPLKVAFEKLYSYTNDKGGIRHSEGLFVSDVTFEEAKFMLVSCSAFVNYLIAEYGKIE